MIINQKNEQGTLYFAPMGRLDTTTASEFERELMASLDGITSLVLDFKGVEYVSSAGLRVILKAQKRMSADGNMKISGANAIVMEVFEVTGFADILTIE